MFAKQIAALQELRSLLPDRAVDILQQILCNAKQPLEHRGPVHFTHGTKDGADHRAINLPSGAEMMAHGEVYGVPKWRKATSASAADTNGATGEIRSKCSAKLCEDIWGNRMAGPAKDVYMAGPCGAEIGDVLAVFRDEDERRIALNLTAPGIRLGKVQAGYDNRVVYDGDSDTLPDDASVKLCNFAGDETGSAFNVKIIKRSNRDVALFTGQIIAFMVDPAGNRIAVSDVYDLPMTKVIWEGVSTANIRSGWALCDGTVYGSITTPDLKDKFIKCKGAATSIGGEGGYALHGGTGAGADNNHTSHAISNHRTLDAHSISDHSISAHTISDHSISAHTISDHSISAHTISDHAALPTHVIYAHTPDYDPGDHALGAHSIANHTITYDPGDWTPASHPDHTHRLPEGTTWVFTAVNAYTDVTNLDGGDFDTALTPVGFDQVSGAEDWNTDSLTLSHDAYNPATLSNTHAHAGSTLTHDTYNPATYTTPHAHDDSTLTHSALAHSGTFSHATQEHGGSFSHATQEHGGSFSHATQEHSGSFGHGDPLEHGTALAHSVTSNEPQHYILAAIMRVS